MKATMQYEKRWAQSFVFTQTDAIIKTQLIKLPHRTDKCTITISTMYRSQNKYQIYLNAIFKMLTFKPFGLTSLGASDFTELLLKNRGNMLLDCLGFTHSFVIKLQQLALAYGQKWSSLLTLKESAPQKNAKSLGKFAISSPTTVEENGNNDRQSDWRSFSVFFFFPQTNAFITPHNKQIHTGCYVKLIHWGGKWQKRILSL